MHQVWEENFVGPLQPLLDWSIVLIYVELILFKDVSSTPVSHFVLIVNTLKIFKKIDSNFVDGSYAAYICPIIKF